MRYQFSLRQFAVFHSEYRVQAQEGAGRIFGPHDSNGPNSSYVTHRRWAETVTTELETSTWSQSH